ncbi:hypothetical protein SAMN02910298_02787 [Pseudobutyrivibrio sp. YE44]|uniref:hypothetical protein n=1 Tax=Pseudobutyrivibrio sp. YE44 TaxID=1520802 RepID=UPI0008816843|nr:hypothetical protein [Pseudobutyrivibrio sp. YE44]SDB54419.1 hypothetical protein SAMN02910298_02787 [Pseudobutyrivibrio sp. YE44]
MRTSKFESIINHNMDNIEEARACVDRFYSLLGMEEESEIMNIAQVARSLFLYLEEVFRNGYYEPQMYIMQ